MGTVQIVEQLVGPGAEARAGARVEVHDTGWLLDGKPFDSSRGGSPFSFDLGAGSPSHPSWPTGCAASRA